MGLMAMICQEHPPQFMACTFMGGSSTSPLAEPLPDVADALPSLAKGGVMGVADDDYPNGAEEPQLSLTYKAEPKAEMPKKPSLTPRPDQEYYIAGSWDEWSKHDMTW